MEVVVIQPRSEVPLPEPKYSDRERLLTIDVIGKDGLVTHYQARFREVKAALKERGGVALFRIQLVTDRKPKTVLILKIDLNEDKSAATHMTVREVAGDDVVRVKVPVNAVGISTHVQQNLGVLVQQASRLKVQCAVAKLPAGINVPVDALEMGGSICASDIKLPDGVQLAATKDEVLFSMQQVSDAKPVRRSPKPVSV